MCHLWLRELEVAQDLSVHITIRHDITDHHETQICQSH
jgi:hypothetical protein